MKMMKRLVALGAVLGGLSAAVNPSLAQTWVAMTAPSTNIAPIACSADGGKLVLAGGGWMGPGGVIYVSHDSGATWTAPDVPVGLWGPVASSADGTTLMAAELDQGAIYTSHDSGATWGRNDLPGGLWTQLACSADGARLLAAGGAIYASGDSGRTWAPAGAPAAGWGGLACSADGTKVLAGEGTNVWVSTNSGAAFRLACTLAPCASVACSADGTRMAAGGVTGNDYPYVGVVTSADSGATWTWSSSAVPGSVWGWVAMLTCSADGSRMAAVSGGGAFPVDQRPGGILFLSSDSGASWTGAPAVPYPFGGPATWAPWTGLALSADGCKLFGVYVAGPFFAFAGGAFTLQTTPAPALAVGRSGGDLVLSWTVPSINFVLQRNPDLGSTNWTDVPGAPVLDYPTLRNQMIIPPPPGPMFYRLVSRQ